MSAASAVAPPTRDVVPRKVPFTQRLQALVDGNDPKLLHWSVTGTLRMYATAVHHVLAVLQIRKKATLMKHLRACGFSYSLVFDPIARVMCYNFHHDTFQRGCELQRWSEYGTVVVSPAKKRKSHTPAVSPRRGALPPALEIEMGAQLTPLVEMSLADTNCLDIPYLCLNEQAWNAF